MTVDGIRTVKENLHRQAVTRQMSFTGTVFYLSSLNKPKEWNAYNKGKSCTCYYIKGKMHTHDRT